MQDNEGDGLQGEMSCATRSPNDARARNHSHSEEEDRNLDLPSLVSALPPSIRALQEKKNRKIETEFGTIIIDDRGIVLHSDVTESQTVVSSQTTSSITKRTLGSISDVKHFTDHYVGSRMYVMNTSKTSSRVLEIVKERQQRLDRGAWRSDRELLLVICSALCGIDSMLAFPVLWLRHGGAAFQIAYTVSCAVLALPLLGLEATLGQYSAHGMAALMPQMGPALRGFSYALLLSLVTSVVAHMSDMSSLAVYSADALRQPQPWMSCGASYNDAFCFTRELDLGCRRAGAVLFAAGRCVGERDVCGPHPRDNSSTLWQLRRGCRGTGNATSLDAELVRSLRHTASSQYFSSVPHRLSNIRHQHSAPSLLALLGMWLAAAVMAQAGLLGVWRTLPLLFGLPLLIVVALAVNMVLSFSTLQKIWRNLIPDVGQLANGRCWLQAGAFSLQSLGVGTGINAMIYSRNLLTHDCKRSTFKVTLIMLALTCLFGFTFTFVLGQHAYDLDAEVSDLLRENQHHHPIILLATSLGKLKNSQLWSSLLFSAIVLFGLGSLQVALLAIETTLRELALFKTLSTRWVVVLLCICLFMIDLLMTFPNGYYASLTINTYVVSLYGMVLSLALSFAVNAVLGVDRLLDDMTDHMAVHMKWSRTYWSLTWRYACPLLLVVLFTCSVVLHVGESLSRDVDRLPEWTAVFGGLMVLLPLLLLVGVVFRVYMASDSVGVDLFMPTPLWQPGLLPHALAAAGSELLSGQNASSQYLMSYAPSLMTTLYSALVSNTSLPASDGKDQASLLVLAPVQEGTGPPSKEPSEKDADQPLEGMDRGGSDATRVEAVTKGTGPPPGLKIRGDKVTSPEEAGKEETGLIDNGTEGTVTEGTSRVEDDTAKTTKHAGLVLPSINQTRHVP